MKLLKSAAVRATALLLFFAMIAAVVLYQAGVYDIVFIQRPVVTVPEDSDTEADTTEPDDTTLPPDTTEPNDTTVPPDTTEPPQTEPKPPVDLNEILSLSQATELGYALSSARFDSDSILTRLAYDFGKNASVFSLRTEKITSTVFYMKESGLIATKDVTEVVDKPRVGLYFGLILIDNGKTVDIYNADGKQIVKKFSGKLIGALSENGKPVVEVKSKYYEIDRSKGLSSAIPKSSIRFNALAFDHPQGYGANAFDLYPYSAYVDVYTEVTLEEDTSEPEETNPDDTTTDPDVSEPTDTDSTDSETDPDDTTDESGETTTGPDDTDSVEGEPTPDDTTTESDETTTEPDDTTTESDTSEPQDTSASEPVEEVVVMDETLAENNANAKPLPEGVVEINGKYYKVTQKLMWGYRNAAGETVIEPQFASAYAFSKEGLAAVTDFDGSVFYINTKGKEIISIRDQVYIKPPEMSGIRIRQFYFEPVTNGLENIGTYYFDEGYTMIRYCWVSNFNAKQLYRNEFRLVDPEGNVFEIPGSYTLKSYSDGILLLEKDGRFGYMDTSGAWISPAVYQKAYPFLQGLAVAVNEDGKYGLLDRSGNEVLPFVFDHISNVSDGKVVTFSADRGWEIYGIADRSSS